MWGKKVARIRFSFLDAVWVRFCLLGVLSALT